MPRLVTDQNLWRISAATVCVGQSEHPERVEWELQSGAYFGQPLTRAAVCIMKALPKRNRTRETGPALFATPVSFVRKLGRGTKPARAFGQPFYSLRTIKTFWSIRPRLKSTKNWSPDSHRGSRLHFEWKASGFTVVSFWTVPGPTFRWASWHWNSAPGARLRPGTAQAALRAGRLSPNRCLAGLRPPRAVQS